MNTPNPHPVVVMVNDQHDHDIDEGAWRSLAESVLTNEGIGPEAELTITFVDRDAMTILNEQHMAKHGPTDVLSFPLEDDALAETPETLIGRPRLLGDVVICPDVVHAQAPDAPVDEMALMVVHGVLHILGMDHQEPVEEAEMKAAEQRHLTRWRSGVVA